MNTKIQTMSDRTTAIIVGILFIIGTVAGMSSVAFTGSILASPDFLVQVSENENQIIAGAILVLIMGFALAMVPVMLFPIFKKYNEALALGAVLFRGALEAVAYIIVAIFWLLLIVLGREFAAAGFPDGSHFQTMGILLQDGSAWIGYILSMVFSIGALMIYTLFYQSKLIPRWLSVWGLIGAVLYLAHPLIAMFGTVLDFLFVPLAVQEMVFALWLIVKGFNSKA